MKLQKGFSLIELMIVVAIIAILARIAIPMYVNYVIRGKIPDATSNLASKRTQMEQYYQDNRFYSSALNSGLCPVSIAPDATSSRYFTFSCTVITNSSYTIQALGTGSMAGFTYTIDQGNNKQTTAAPAAWATPTMPGTPAPCWITKQGGQC